jgi:hypothetical protein
MHSAKRSELFYGLFCQKILHRLEIFLEFICERGFKKSRNKARILTIFSGKALLSLLAN